MATNAHNTGALTRTSSNLDPSHSGTAMPKCAACAYFIVRQKGGPLVDDHWGECHRKAPRINDEALRRIVAVEGAAIDPETPFDHLQLATLWPVVSGAMGCGDHVPAAPAAPGVQPAPAPLATAIAHYRAAAAEAADHYETTYSRGLTAWEAAVAAIPHHRTEATFVTVNNERISLSTESEDSIATARRVMRDVKEGHVFSRGLSEVDAGYVDTLRELVIAADKREIEVAALRSRHRIDENMARSDTLANTAAKTLDAALATPARDLTDLLTKAELIEESDDWDRASDSLLADLRRLAAEVRS